jgi:hypothetical protein
MMRASHEVTSEEKRQAAQGQPARRSKLRASAGEAASPALVP